MSFAGTFIPPQVFCPCNGVQPEFVDHTTQKLTLKNFIYQKPPEWFDALGREIFPVRFSIDINQIRYNYLFPRIPGNVRFLRTEEDIYPTVITDEGVANVERINRDNGLSLWKITFVN